MRYDAHGLLFNILVNIEIGDEPYTGRPPEMSSEMAEYLIQMTVV